MKKLFTVLVLLTIGLASTRAQSMGGLAKKFEWNELENRTLLIPTYNLSERYIEKLMKRSKNEKLANKQERADMFNTAWTEGLAESFYDATPYEIKSFDQKALIKSKSTKFMMLTFTEDKYGNVYVNVFLPGPKKKLIATTIVNGFNLYEKRDVRLMMNILNNSLLTAGQIYDEEGVVKRKDQKGKSIDYFQKFYADISNKTFYVPILTVEDSKKKYETINAEVKETLANDWEICNSKQINHEELDEVKNSGNDDGFYIRVIRINTQYPFPFFYNLVLTTEKDGVLSGFIAKAHVRSSNIKKLQEKLQKWDNKFKNK